MRKFWLAVEILAGISLVILLVIFVDRKMEDRNYLAEQQQFKQSLTMEKILKKGNQLSQAEKDRVAREKVQQLKAKHAAVVAIIEIPATEILYPIVQGKDNQFYLNHDKDGNYHRFGEVFLDSRNTAEFSDANSVVYGHNIESAQTIFSELLNYENPEYFHAHDTIYIYSLAGFKEYKVVSVFKAQPEEPYREMSFQTQAAYDRFVEKYHQQSLVATEKPDSERLLTLSTCFDRQYRLVIQAVEVQSENLKTHMR